MKIFECVSNDNINSSIYLDITLLPLESYAMTLVFSGKRRCEFIGIVLGDKNQKGKPWTLKFNTDGIGFFFGEMKTYLHPIIIADYFEMIGEV